VGVLPAPRALLLDFGGVIVESTPSDDDLDALVGRVHLLIRRALSEEEIRTDLKRADKQRSADRNASADHVEIKHEQLWGQYVAEHWPAEARATVIYHAVELTRLWARRPGWRLRQGITDLLDYTLGRGLPVAVVSNTRSGLAHREVLDDFGVSPAFATQIYSDEVGVFKPHPEMIWAAARELSVSPGACWFVGDQVAKDIACARAAGAGAAILMPSSDREQPAEPVPDLVVADGHELLAALREQLDSAS
jgi:N-acetyl-D-muramate 6-phosphate phosphatase